MKTLDNYTTSELCKEIVDRVGDHLNDPEPKHDEMLESLTPHVIQQLSHGCAMALHWKGKWYKDE